LACFRIQKIIINEERRVKSQSGCARRDEAGLLKVLFQSGAARIEEKGSFSTHTPRFHGVGLKVRGLQLNLDASSSLEVSRTGLKLS
jgi:hypothetical protein